MKKAQPSSWKWTRSHIARKKVRQARKSRRKAEKCEEKCRVKTPKTRSYEASKLSATEKPYKEFYKKSLTNVLHTPLLPIFSKSKQNFFKTNNNSELENVTVQLRKSLHQSRGKSTSVQINQIIIWKLQKKSTRSREKWSLSQEKST